MVAHDGEPTPPSRHALAAALYALVATFLCYPVLHDPAHSAVGHPSDDVWNHVWGFWWVQWSLSHAHWPVYTELLAWPRGGSLWFIDILGAVTTLPVQWVAGPVAAYNTSIWLNFALCGVGGYVLGLAVSHRWWGGLAAGVVYMTTPHLLGQAYNGISETIAAGWLPLSVVAMRRTARDPTIKNGALTGVLVGLTSLASWYYGLFAAIIMSGLLVRGAMRRIGGSFWRDRWKIEVLASAAGASVLIAIAGPAFLAFSRTMNAGDALVTRDPAFVWRTLIMHNMTDALSLVHPGKFYSPDLHAAFGEDLIVVVYMGMAAWIPGLFVLFTPTRKRAAPWAALASVFVLLSLGPYLFVDGHYVAISGGWIPLPFLGLFRGIPLFSRISHAYRFAVGTSLALSVLISLAVRAAPRFGVPASVAAVTLAALRMYESLSLSPAIWPLPTATIAIPAIYGAVHDGAVLDLPITLPVLARSRVIVNQLVHHQPVPFSLNDPVPEYLYDNHYTRYLLTIERMNITFLPPEIPQLNLAVGMLDLREHGFRWIVVHRDAYTADQASRILTFLDLTAQAVADDETIRLYDLAADVAVHAGPETRH